MFCLSVVSVTECVSLISDKINFSKFHLQWEGAFASYYVRRYRDGWEEGSAVSARCVHWIFDCGVPATETELEARLILEKYSANRIEVKGGVFVPALQLMKVERLLAGTGYF